MKTYTSELEELRAANAALIQSNTDLRRQRNEARSELKLRKEDVSRQWTVNDEIKTDLARVTAELAEQKNFYGDVAAIRAELARLQAELVDADRGADKRLKRMLKAEEKTRVQFDELSILRARVAELEQYNRDLACALEHEAKIHPEDFEPGDFRSRAVLNARADSATPDKHPDTVRDVLEQFHIETIRHAANAIFNKLSEVYSCGTHTEQGRQALFKAQRLADAIVASPNASAAMKGGARG